MGFWLLVSRIILKNKYTVLLFVVLATLFLGNKATHMRLSHTEANMLPDDHEVSIQYQQFLKVFGEEGNIIILGVNDSTLFTTEKFNQWNAFNKSLSDFEAIEFVISTGNLQTLQKDTLNKKFVLKNAFSPPKSQNDIAAIKNLLFANLPFYNNLLYNNKTETLQTIVHLKKDIVNTPTRKKFILNKLIPAIEKFETESQLNIHTSGMPYVRTMNSQNIVDEIELFVLLALLVTALIFFMFFRSFRATLITLTVVSIGVIWACGFIGWFDYEITVLTGLIPPLIIVIGVPNAIFLINKYQQEVKKHGNKVKSLQRVISKIGNATLMTNVTTASGFATFIFTKSQLLKEFGVIASISIMSIYFISLLIIPTLYNLLPLPKKKHLLHLDKQWMELIIRWMTRMVRHKKVTIYTITVVLIIFSLIGANKMKVSGSLIEDMPKKATFFKDIVFFEQEFGGIMPLEILIDTKKEKGVYKLSSLKKIEQLCSTIEEIEELSKPIAITNLVKYTKQAYYNGNSKYYQLPTNQEKSFILPYIKNTVGNLGALKSMIDSTGRYARVTTYLKNVGINKMEDIEKILQRRIDVLFPSKKFEVTMTGKALVFFKGTNYLIFNLILSLSLAILLISLFMGGMFQSIRMILISLIPNLLPLLVTAGMMGYLGVPIKPSTILIFSIAFGISVDDTIHFLAKYRQELIANNRKIRISVFKALRETGVSMFYTSIVLFFGFFVFVVSSFGGTKALGGLVSITLLLAMISNLLLLPSLLLTFEDKINKNRLELN